MEYDDEMIFLLLQDEENVAANQDEHLTILDALLQMQSNGLRNAALTRGGSKSGRRKIKER
jgi:hypothetical protein